MDADGKVNGHYLTVQATASTDALARLADDPTHPTAVRERAASELDRLDQDRPAVELVRAARAAIERHQPRVNRRGLNKRGGNRRRRWDWRGAAGGGGQAVRAASFPGDRAGAGRLVAALRPR